MTTVNRVYFYPYLLILILGVAMDFGNVITITQLCAFYRVHKVQLYKTNIQVLKLCQIDLFLFYLSIARGKCVTFLKSEILTS